MNGTRDIVEILLTIRDFEFNSIREFQIFNALSYAGALKILKRFESQGYINLVKTTRCVKIIKTQKLVEI